MGYKRVWLRAIAVPVAVLWWSVTVPECPHSSFLGKVATCIFPKPSVHGVYVGFTCGVAGKLQAAPASEQEIPGLGRGIRWADGP